ncbi:MAG: copper amine oxidase N-terminal domain-containing protein [Chitinophagales bacterium]
MKPIRISKLNIGIFILMMLFPLLGTNGQVQAATPKVEINGATLSFDVPPTIENGRILVPLRTVFEKMGAQVSWDSATATVKAVKGSTVVVLQIGSLTPTINGNVKPIDVAGKTVHGRTLAPLRFVCEAFGGTVNWNADTQTATVKTKQGLTVGEDKGF